MLTKRQKQDDAHEFGPPIPLDAYAYIYIIILFMVLTLLGFGVWHLARCVFGFLWVCGFVWFCCVLC